MKGNTTSRKIISLLISAVMVLTMIPVMAFTSVAATNRVYAAGEWNYGSSQINSNRTGFSSNGPFYISMAIADTDFVFMQTEDNQEFTYTTNFYCKKNNRPNEVFLDWVTTDAEFDRTFANMVTSTSWALTGGQVDNPNPDGSPNAWDGKRVGLKAEGLNGGKFTTYSYTTNFIANGSAVYHPTWEIKFTSRGAGIGYTQETHYTSYTVIDGESEAQNLNPVFTIRVIDMRELRTLVNMANAANINITDITQNRDLTGNSYYTQETIDTMVAALRERLLCDYTYLDAQIARAAAVEENVDGALGGHLYDDAAYSTFETAYAQALAVDRYLTDNVPGYEGYNQSIIDNAAAALASAVDALSAARKALVNYYVDGELFARNTCELGKNYNFHDVTDKFISEPTKDRFVFTKWVDEDGNAVSGNTLITGDMNVYARFELRMEGIAPLTKDGKWEHKLSANDSDGRGDNYISMWVENINFNFMQTQDNETFSFYTDLTAYKNDGGNTVRVNDVYLLPNDADTQAFISAIGSHNIDVYCATKNSDDIPNNSGLPGALGSGYSYQSTIYRVVWRYIYTFDANGEATYRPKWNIEYTSGLWALSAGDHDLPDGGDPYVQFTINVTDARPLIEIIDKAESILNNSNNNFTETQKAALRAVLDDINTNYTLDGSVYYDQQTINTQVERIKNYIPDSLVVACDYTVLDAVIAQANAFDREHGNDNNHYIDEVWNNFLNAYNAATTVDRNLNVDDHNINQPMIDRLAENLDFAIRELTYNTHVNVHADDSALQDLIDDAIADIGTDNSNGQYDDDAWQDYLDALDNAQDVIDQDLYIDSDGNNDNQQTIDDALQDLQDAINNLNNNKNDPCDYTALDAAIAAAEAMGDNADHQYTAATYEALQDAIAAGQAVDRDLYDDDAGVNQGIIDDAAQAINDAIAALTENSKVDTTELENAVDDAENNQPGTDNSNGKYDDDAWQDYLDALDDAQDVIDNPPYDDEGGEGQQIVDDALQALEDAIANLENGRNDPCDYSELEDAIAAAQSIGDSSLFTDTTYQALQDALAAAEAVDRDLYVDDAGVNQGIIDDAADALKQAIQDLLEETIITAYNDVDTYGMTQDSVDGLNAAIEAAEDVRDDITSTAQEKADAINALVAAVEDLEVDKAELEDLISIAENIDTSILPDFEADELADAIAAAQTVDNDPDATVDDVIQAIEDLTDAIAQALINATTAAENIDTDGMTDASAQALEDAIQAANDLLDEMNNPANTVTAQEMADAINDLSASAENLTPDKTELEEAIAAGEEILNNIDLPQAIEDALQDAVDDGNDVDNNPDATVQEIKDAIDAINDAIDNALQDKIDEANNTDTSSMDDESKQALEDAIDNAENVANDPDATAQEKADAINAIEDALNNLSEVSRLIPTAAGGLYVNRADSSNIYLEGVDTADTSVAALRAKFENDGRQIVFYRGSVKLGDTDLVGTGCVVKCVSVNDESIVYEQATVILYGDVNGDGRIDGDDYDLMLGEALMGTAIEGKVFRLAGDVNNDGVIDGFDMAQVELEWSGVKKLNQIGRSLKANVTELDITTVTTAGGETAVDKAVRFTAVETFTEIASKDYKDWDVDFAVSFNKNVNGSDVSLYGQYDAYGENWIGGELSDGEIAAGEKVYLINDWINGAVPSSNQITVNYSDIVTVVRDMNTAVRVANPESGLTATVELVVTDPVTGNAYTIATYSYTY
jgi:hypothetical protein